MQHSALGLLLVLTATVQAGEFLWIEAESSRQQQLTRHPWWYDKVKKAELSGGEFVSNWGKSAGAVAYELEIAAAKDYHFWVRANHVQSKLSYSLDGAELIPIDLQNEQRDPVNLAEDDKPDLRFVTWAKAGVLKLSKGKHTLKFRMHSDNNNHGMLDCFVLSSQPFTPNGLAKPGEKVAPAAESGRWAFVPPADEFKPEALLDLRALNEKIAGESGFVQLSKDGNDFMLGNGKPARFWALNDYVPEKKKSMELLARHARFLAKRGVNMVRAHANITTAESLTGIDTHERDNLWKLVATMKKEGIYVTFSPYWACSSRISPKLGVLDAGEGGNMGLLFFDPKLQAAYKGWMKQVLTEKNPYTGLALRDDPALAIIQIQNEDSLLFWSSQKIQGTARTELRRQFAAFIKAKYGTLEKAKEAWGGAMPGGNQDAADNFAQNELALYIIWQMTQRQGHEGMQKRLSDQFEFFTRTMFNFNQMIGDYLKQELGCKQLVNAGNWRAADNVIMLDAERWSYSANPVMGVNRYYSGQHEGQHAGWAIVNGDKFTDESVLLNPRALPVSLKQVEGYPMIIPESSWVPPQGYQSEGPLLVAAYQSLNGVDAFYWFATGEEDWRHPGSANGYLPSEGKWVLATPMLLGQFPAAALLFRLNCVKRGEPVVFEQRTLQDLWQRRMPIIAEDAGYDPNRDKDYFSRESNVKNGVDPLAYLVGPVLTRYGGDPAKSRAADLKAFLLDGGKKVKSNTGELELDTQLGLCLLNTPKAQGVSGFLKRRGSFKLADVELACGNEYATVLVVALDEHPLKTSAKVLVQVGTVARPTNWKTKPAELKGKPCEEIVNYGKAPWQIVHSDVTLTIQNTKLTKARVLDVNFMPVAEIALKDAGAGKSFRLPPDAMYVVLQ